MMALHASLIENHNAHLDPTKPEFFPKRTELQVPRCPQILSLEDMKRYIEKMDATHVNDMTQIGKKTHETARSISKLELKCAFAFRRLEQRIRDLQDNDQEASNLEPEEGSFSVLFPGYSIGQNFKLPEHYYEGSTNEELASVYLGEADRAEHWAVRLREHAEEILSFKSAPKAIERRASPSLEENSIVYACCGMAFESPKHLWEHIEDLHASSFARTQIRPDTLANSISEDEIPASPTAWANRDKIKPPKDDQDDIVSTGPVSRSTIPRFITQLQPFTGFVPQKSCTFTREFLSNILNGSHWSSGFYYIAKTSRIPLTGYWILEAENEPYLPLIPGQHGAKLTPFFREDDNQSGPSPEDYLNVPVFIRAKDSREYQYFGVYCQSRFSDKVSYDELMNCVPDCLLRSWAEHLSATGRADWVTHELKNHFWPMPKYEGRIPTDSISRTPAHSLTGESSVVLERDIQEDLRAYMEELKAWRKEADLKVNLLTPEAIYKSFTKADADLEPGLRLWWEYFECVGYDAEFYDMLVSLKNNPRVNPEGAVRSTGSSISSCAKDSFPVLNGSEIDQKGSSAIVSPRSSGDSSARTIEQNRAERKATEGWRPAMAVKSPKVDKVMEAPNAKRKSLIEQSLRSCNAIPAPHARKGSGSNADIQAVKDCRNVLSNNDNSSGVKNKSERRLPPHLHCK